jgi:endo-1,4-beta-xylanase
MAPPRRSLVIVAFSFSAVLMAACVGSGSPSDESGTGGTSSTGGTTGIAGNGSTGQGAGGVTGTGGRAGMGGSAAGMAGVVGTGDVTGTGGGAGTDGGGTGGGGTGNGAGTGGATGAGGVAGTGGLTGRGGITGTGGNGGATGTGGRAGTTGSGGGGSTGRGGANGGSTGTGGTPAACSTTMVPSGGTSHCSSNQSGTVGSQQWTIWSSGSGGCLITYGSSTAFSATWNNSGDFLARVGLSLGSNKTYDQFAAIAADFAETKSGNGGGYSSIGVYGWSVSPLVEWYVTEDSYNGLGTSGTKKGTFTIDGEGTYNVYQRMQNNQPSIQGNASFPQFISIRTSARTCGHISLSKHFDAWKGFGMTLGKMEEAKVLVEAGGGSGRIDFPTANVTAQ